jgi:hypothetical protein
MSLTILVISTLLIVVATESQDVFASNGDGPKQKHIDKHEEKHGDKHDDKKKEKHGDKHDDKKKEKHKDKHDDKKKEKLKKHIGKIIQKIKEKIADYKEKSSKKITPKVDDDKDETNPVTSTNDDEVKTPDIPNTDDEQTSVQGEVTSQGVEMNHFKGSGNDYAPTLGSDRYGNNYVDNGFTFNDFVTDVENFKTHMPLQTLNVGELNTAVLKIYDNRGAGKIEHVELAFGLDSREYVSQSDNSIIWTQNFKGDQSIIENDPNNLLMDVSATGKSNGKIMEITFNFAFREPMDKSKIGVVIWDHDRHSRTIYFNEGIEVVGESLNPPEIINIIDEKGNPVRITMTGKSEGIDEDGNIWTHNSPWIKQKMSVDKTLAHENPEPVGNHGFDRSHNMFDSYKNSQAQTAQEKLIEILGGRNINNFSD